MSKERENAHGMGETPEWTGNGRKGSATALTPFFGFFQAFGLVLLSFWRILKAFRAAASLQQLSTEFRQHFCGNPAPPLREPGQRPCNPRATTVHLRATFVPPSCTSVQPSCHLRAPPCNLRAPPCSLRATSVQPPCNLRANIVRAARASEAFWLFWVMKRPPNTCARQKRSKSYGLAAFHALELELNELLQTCRLRRLLVKSSKDLNVHRLRRPETVWNAPSPTRPPLPKRGGSLNCRKAPLLRPHSLE